MCDKETDQIQPKPVIRRRETQRVLKLASAREQPTCSIDVTLNETSEKEFSEELNMTTISMDKLVFNRNSVAPTNSYLNRIRRRNKKEISDKSCDEPIKNKLKFSDKKIVQRYSVPVYPTFMTYKGYDDLMETDSEFGTVGPSWCSLCDIQTLTNMSKNEIKMQNLVHELYMTECTTVRALKMMELYSLSFLNDLEMSVDTVVKLFPVLDELMKFHSEFYQALKSLRPNINDIVANIGKTISHFFTATNGENVTRIYSTFCHLTQDSILLLKENIRTSKKFAAYLQKCMDNVIFHNRSIQDLHQVIVQRISKYPIIVSEMIKHAEPDTLDRVLLEEAKSNILEVLQNINSNINAKKLQVRKEEITSAFDRKSSVIFNGEDFSRSNISGNNLLFEMGIQMRLLSGKLIDAILLIMDDLVIFLQRTPNHKYSFCTADGKSAVIPLKNLLTRDNATEQNCFFLISKTAKSPEMYEIHCAFRSELHILTQKVNKFTEEAKMNESKSEDCRKQTDVLRHKRIHEYIDTIFRIDQHIFDLLDERLYNHIDIHTYLYDEKNGVVPARSADPFDNYLYSCLHYERETALSAFEADQSSPDNLSQNNLRKYLSAHPEITRSSTLDTCNAAVKFKNSRPFRTRLNTCPVSNILPSPDPSIGGSIHVPEKPFEVLKKSDKVNFDKIFPQILKHPAKPVFPFLYELFSYNDSVLKSAISIDSSFKAAKIQLDEANRCLEECKNSGGKQKGLNKLGDVDKGILMREEALVQKERDLSQREAALKSHVGIMSIMLEYGTFNMECIPENIARAFDEMVGEYKSTSVSQRPVQSIPEKQSVPSHLMSATNQRRLMLSSQPSNPSQQTSRLLQLSTKSKVSKDQDMRIQFRTSDLGDEVKPNDNVSERELYF